MIISRKQLRKFILKEMKLLNEVDSGGDVSAIKAPWRNIGAYEITGIVMGMNEGILIKQGFAGDRYVIYSDKPFKINGNASSEGSCWQLELEQKKKLGVVDGDESVICHKKVFYVRGNIYESKLLIDATEDNQYMLIEGI